MLIKLTGGRIYDPANGVDGEVRDIFIENGRIVSPSPNAKVDQEYAVHGRVIMAGGIDPHSHIGGGKMTIARMMLPEDHIGQEFERTDITRAGVGYAIPSTMTAGYRYAEMGYTAAFEPAMLPSNARQAHMELADTAIIDKPHVEEGEDLAAVLRKAADYAFQVALRPRSIELMRLMIAESARFPELMTDVGNKIFSRFLANLAQVFGELADRKMIPDGDHAQSAELFADLVLGNRTVMIYFVWANALSAEKYLDAKIELFINGRLRAK